MFDELIHFNFKGFIYHISLFFIFIKRLFKYQIFTTTKCPECKDPMYVYFRRSERSVGMGFDKYDLHDWLICQNEYCDYKEKIKEGEIR